MKFTHVLIGFVVAFLTVSSTFAQPGANTPGFISQAQDQGPIDPFTPVTVNVWLKLHNQQQLDSLFADQNHPKSANYHRWITQDQFNASYGPTAQEVNAVSNFLAAHNLNVLFVAENNMYVKAQGTAADIQTAFGVQINNYTLNGVSYRSNQSDPSIGDPAGGLVAAITGLDDYGFQPNAIRPVTAEGGEVPLTPIASGPDGLFFEGQCFRPPETHTFHAGATTAVYTGNRFGSDITSGFGH